MTDVFLLATSTPPAVPEVGITDFFTRGGVFMVPLLVASLVGLAAILYKLLSLAPSRVIPAALAAELAAFERRLAAGKADAMMQEFHEGRSALARLAGVTLRHRGKSREEITQAVEAAAREEAVRLHSGIGVLDVVITVAPLLGLLGTASGLVVIFEGLGDTTNYVAIARGIAVALNTTITGLAIAVPCVIAHSYFTRRIERYSARLESLLSELIQSCQGRRPQA